jgi:NADPH:quinone reductase-like Zn-dependent oxidoreductase
LRIDGRLRLHARSHHRGDRADEKCTKDTFLKAVRFDRYGDVDVLNVVEVPDPVPTEGEVLVQVKAAGINPGETLIRTGALRDRWPAAFPIELGVAPERIDTTIDYEAAVRHGATTDGSAEGASAHVLAELAQLIADGKLEIPIARTYPLEQVRDAYRELERRHTLGKIVLHP